MTDLYNVTVDVRLVVDGKIEQKREADEVIEAEDMRDFVSGIHDTVFARGFAGMQVTIESNVPSVLDAREANHGV